MPLGNTVTPPAIRRVVIALALLALLALLTTPLVATELLVDW